MNERNEDRITFRDFTKQFDAVGMKLDQKQMKKVYDHIASSVKKERYITSKTWVKGIDIAHKQANTKALYTAILNGKQYDPQPGREEIDMEEIRIKLKDTKAPWMYRVECMESLSRQITVKSMKSDKFHTLFRQYHISLTVQAKDRRSGVSRVACEVFAKIILRWKNEFLKYSYTTIEYIYELVRQKIKVVHESGLSVLIVLLKNCGDHKEFKMMDILGKEGTTSKFVNLQKDCFDLLLLYVKQQNETLKSKKEFWSKLMEYTKKGVNDTADVRNSALRVLAQIESERPNIVKDVVNKMNVHLKKRYENEYRIQGGSVANGGYDEEEKKESKPKKIKTAKNGGGSKGKSSTNGAKSGAKSPEKATNTKAKGKSKGKTSANFPVKYPLQTYFIPTFTYLCQLSARIIMMYVQLFIAFVCFLFTF